MFWGHMRLTNRSLSNAASRMISLHELKKVLLQEHFLLVTQDSIGHLKTLCMSLLSLAVAFECEWKHYSSSQSNENTQVFEYEFSFSATYASLVKNHTSVNAAQVDLPNHVPNFTEDPCVSLLYIQIPPDQLHRFHMMQYCWGYYRWSTVKGTLRVRCS